MSQPVTTNPFLIAVINMTVVFGVLYGLSLIIRLIQLIDPTRKKSGKTAQPTPAALPEAEAAPAPAAAQDEGQLLAVITAAIAAYGCRQANILSVRRMAGGQDWLRAARLAAVNIRSRMF